jgi:hypothetical protein
MIVRPVAMTPEQTTMLNIMLGALATSFGTVVQFWLGSSAGSKSKDQAIADLTGKGAPTHANQ